jgi:hypothetical protein
MKKKKKKKENGMRRSPLKKKKATPLFQIKNKNPFAFKIKLLLTHPILSSFFFLLSFNNHSSD